MFDQYSILHYRVENLSQQDIIIHTFKCIVNTFYKYYFIFSIDSFINLADALNF
jgi:hypothetical protein